mgnify:FL=1|tara:strand:- start:63 stop:488 length:426 start_codon:yes stop_codon:yes gene_type:complete
MAHKTELRSFLAASGGLDGVDDSTSAFRAIDEAKNKLDDTLNIIRSTHDFFTKTCEIPGLTVERGGALNKVKEVSDALTAAQVAVAALTYVDLADHWPADKATVSDLTDYVAPVVEDSPAVTASAAESVPTDDDAPAEAGD